jgi:hypothetical protein
MIQVDPIEDLIPIEIGDPQYFEDVSWTVAYSPAVGSWLSFYSFLPNYYVSHNNYFQTGINTTKVGQDSKIWSHLLTNKSYQVFYGRKDEFIVEYPVQGDYTEKYVNNVELWTEAKRYHNNYDYYTNPGITFNKSMIYNNIHCSGDLNLVPMVTNYISAKNFPKTNLNNTQDIGITTGGTLKWTYDYFYNRVKNGTSNIPFLIQDANQIKKNVNSQIVSFKGKPLLERMVGDWFLNRLTYDKDSRYSLSFMFSITDTSKI